MKKIFATIVCAFLVCIMSVGVFAEEVIPVPEQGEGAVTDEQPSVPTPEETPGEVVPEDPTTETPNPEDVPTTETPTEEVLPPATVEPEKSEAEIFAELTTEKIVNYVKMHLEELSVIFTLILTVFYQIRKHAVLNKSIVSLNNNSIAVAKNSEVAINAAMDGVSSASVTIGSYIASMEALTAEMRKSEEEKKRLEEALANVEGYLNRSKLANVELANEVAELLVLANIPNSKKDELYARHIAAVKAIDSTEVPKVTADAEEKNYDGDEK